MSSLQALKQTEQDSLAKLEASYQDATTQVQNFGRELNAHQNSITALYQQMAMFGANNMAAITVAEENCLTILRGHCEHLERWQSYFMSFEPTASTLGTAGLPQLSIRVREVCMDLSRALDR